MKNAEWRAKELRRRVENRRRAVLATNRSSDEEGDNFDDLSLKATSPRPNPPKSDIGTVPETSLPSLTAAKHELYSIQMEVADAQSHQKSFIQCADQQFTIEKNMRRLKSDLQATVKAVHLKSDRLEDLRARILQMTKSLRSSSDERAFAKNRIITQKEARQELATIQKCTHCGRGFLPTIFETHQQHCGGRRVVALPEMAHRSSRPTTPIDTEIMNSNQATDADNHLRVVDLPKFISQPPRQLRIADGGVTHDSILLQWDPPIFTGSMPIIDYELQYSTYSTKRTRDGKRERIADCVTTFRTSHWCLKRPVPSNQFLLTHLRADQEYGAITVAAITKNGMSGLSNSVELVKTGLAIAPTQPLFVTVGVVTAKSVTLSWKEPIDDGGKSLVDYEISFIEAVMEETITSEKNFLDVSKVVYKPRLIRTHESTTTYCIVDLLSGKEHKSFRIRAVNSDGIPGEFSDSIESIFTIAPGTDFKLLDELQAAVNARTRVVDSQFLSGFMQRYDRLHYIDLVSRFIISTHPEFADKVRAILERNETVDTIESASNDEIKTVTKTTKRFDELTEEEMIVERRRQFQFRIAALQQEVKRVQYNVQWCKEERLNLVSLIRAAENRILEKQAELERARMFKGPQMDSDVLENGLQRFYSKDLIVALEDEIEIEQLYILDTKAEIVKVENYLRADEKHYESLTKRLDERRIALEKFEIDPHCNREDLTTNTVLLHLRNSLLFRAFTALVQNRREAHDMRRKMQNALFRVANCKLRAAMRHWKEMTRYLGRKQAGLEDSVCGLGSVHLLNVSIGRDELVYEAREILNQLRQTDEDLDHLTWTSDPTPPSDTLPNEKEEKYFLFLQEADAKMDIQDYNGALVLYQYLHSKWLQRMSSQRVFDIQIKIGLAYFHLNKYDQALVQFNRALVLSLHNKRNQGTAMLHTAHVQFAFNSLSSSIESFENALLCFEAMGDKKGELQCYRGLEQAFSKLEEIEMKTKYKVLGDEMEFALQTKLQVAGTQLQHLQQRLVGIGAESSKEMELERVGAIVPRLRRERIKLKYTIQEEIKWISSLQTLLDEKKALLVQGEMDLKRAIASDSTQVDSHVINGCIARYEMEDFKQKLGKLMGSMKAGQDYITKEIQNATIRIRNDQDQIQELESELGVETGVLIRRIQGKEPIRCFCFNATNESLKNVIGTTSHGVSTCVAVAGMNGYLYDLLSGACLSQALGDPGKQHIGEPTGHQGQIVSLFYIEDRIYTGSMDAVLGIWNVKDEYIGGFSCHLVKLMTEFDAAVVSVTADSQWIACGCSDCDIFLFDSKTFGLITRVIGAHTMSTTTIAVQSFKHTFTTGSADHRIKCWEVEPCSMTSIRRKVKLKYTLEAERRGDEYFNGHLHPITCLQQVASEIVSGDTNGRLVIWNLETNQHLLRLCDVHKNIAITCLQFDATKIVTGSANGNICVTDFATGNLIQTLVGHVTRLLDLQFDRKRIISMSTDGKIRLWYWQTRTTTNPNRYQYHILGAGETLKSLSLKYRCSIQNLLEWNKLADSTKVYLGQKLIVNVDTNGTASDELDTLDTSVSIQYGKLSYENLEFLAGNKVQNEDVETQWAAQRLALLAKEYFPPLDEEEEVKKDDEDKEEDVDSDDDSMMAVDEDEETDEKHEDDG